MFEKVNPAHPDKVADRIAGAIVDYCYTKEDNPKVAVEVLIGHNLCTVIIESSVKVPQTKVEDIVSRIDRPQKVKLISVEQDVHLADNQLRRPRCGDNGIFKGMPITNEQHQLSIIARSIYKNVPYDGKYILDNKKKVLVICQSNAAITDIPFGIKYDYKDIVFNPLGSWTGGTSVDSGATNRKLGSDMADSVTGGGLHGKDLSKADVSVNIYAWLKAQRIGEPVMLSCAIGDEEVDGRPYSEIVDIARKYIRSVGGFEKFAEWGLV